MSDLGVLVQKIRGAKTLVLSTHRESDGDGIGSELALFHALQKMGKSVRLLNVDGLPKKYHFLDPEKNIENFEGLHRPLETTDLALIFDTNDERMLAPLFAELREKCKEIVFVDHHPLLKQGPTPTAGSYIEMEAASTGEIVYRMIGLLGLELDAKIARAIYTSIVFDTQLFRFIRKSSVSHQIAAEVLKYEKDPEEVHRRLFGNQTIPKISFLAHALGNIEYYGDGRLALLKIKDHDLIHFGLDTDASRDVIDMVMNIESLEIAVLFREDGPSSYKVSLRSKGQSEVLSVAESLGGGGHLFSSGAYYKGSYEEIKHKTLENLLEILRKNPKV